MGIRWKLMFTYMFVALFVLLAAGIYVSRTMKAQHLSGIREHLRCDADLAGAYILEATKNAPLTYDVDSLADAIGRRLNVRVTLIDPGGKVWGDSELDGDDLVNLEDHGYRLEILEAREGGIGVHVRHSATLSTDMMYLARPIEQGGIRTGFIRLAVPLVEVDQALHDLRRSLGVALLLGLVLAVLISYITARRVVRPINGMSRIAEKMAGGDFSVKTTVRGKDEIGRLAGTINRMSSQLDATIRQITTERDRLRGVLGGMREGVMLTDSKGRIVMTNEAFKSIFGVTMPPEGATPVEATRDARLHQAVEKACESRKEIIDEIELYLPDQRVLYVHVVPLGLPAELTGTVAVLYDVTQLKNLERTRKDFVANVSHELNTPLAAIRGYAETLQGKAMQNPETATQFLQIIARNAERMTKLVSDLLALSKWESEGYKPSFAPVRLLPLVNSAIETFHEIIEKKGLKVTIDVPDLCPIRADEKGLEQVIVNLLENAVKFNPEGGHITISATEENTVMKIAVTDTGIGIPSTDLTRIFERFYRVDKDRSRELGGTGLGLSIVKHIVQSHGGQVWAESQIGHGSTFFFTLPKA